MNELSLYNTKQITPSQSNQSGGGIASNPGSELSGGELSTSELSQNELSAVRQYRKKVLEQQKYIQELEKRIQAFEKADSQ